MQSWSIQFKNLSAGYNGKAVLKDVNAILPAGKISVILGGSGGGKSTLLRHITGLSRPISGNIFIGNEDISNLKGAALRRLRRRMGVLFQDGALLGSLTIAQNTALPLSQHLHLPKKLYHEAALRILKMVGLEDFAEYFPNQLSGGMRKRAGLARAIIADPAILLCDEPTSGLDPITAARMDDLLLAMHQQFPAMTIIVVSHDLESVKKIADYVMVLGDGKAIFAGTKTELSNSDNAYLQQFLQRNPGKEDFGFTEAANPEITRALQKWLNS